MAEIFLFRFNPWKIKLGSAFHPRLILTHFNLEKYPSPLTCLKILFRFLAVSKRAFGIHNV